jgi:hypothetical protein
MAPLTQEHATRKPRSALRHRPIPFDEQERVVLLPRTTRGKPHYEPHTSGGLPFLAGGSLLWHSSDWACSCCSFSSFFCC